MKLSLIASGLLCAFALQAFIPATAVVANPRSVCQIVPASRAQQIFGTPVKAAETRAPSHDGNSGSLCTYTGTKTGAMLMVIFATSATVAASVEKGQRQIGSSPVRRIGHKVNAVIIATTTGGADDAKIVGGLYDAAMRNL